MRALVVGGTRILRPLVLELARRGDSVDVVARTEPDVRALVDSTPGVAAIVGDATDPSIVERLADYDCAVVYLPDAPPAALVALAGCTATVVHLLTSRWLAPGVGRAELEAASPNARERTVRLLLGRHGHGASARWHTPEEISAAALSALDGRDRERVLGHALPDADSAT